MWLGGRRGIWDGNGVLREGARGIAGVGVVRWIVNLEVRCVVLASFPVDAGHVEAAPVDGGAFSNDSGSFPRRERTFLGDVNGELGVICAGGGRESVGWGRRGVVGGRRGVKQGM